MKNEATVKTRMAAINLATANIPQARVQVAILCTAIADDMQALADRVKRIEQNAVRGY